MSKETHPYELLVRWDEEGRLKGAQIQRRTIYRDEETGEIETYKDHDPEALSLGRNDGFPLGDILSQAQVQALARVSVLEADVIAMSQVVERSDLSAKEATRLHEEAQALIIELQRGLADAQHDAEIARAAVYQERAQANGVRRDLEEATRTVQLLRQMLEMAGAEADVGVEVDGARAARASAAEQEEKSDRVADMAPAT